MKEPNKPNPRKRPAYFKHPPVEALGDFTTTWRVLSISGLASVIGSS